MIATQGHEPSVIMGSSRSVSATAALCNSTTLSNLKHCHRDL
ncbi:hypothetical protein RISK_000785 [Rhodopirellula islandica]|uniref:Uncharacterized protein n=1 Tax=Rhodopirellula islandica TaxID=595434 RepID=A0A0J1ENA2_RHOIS|nr:hypothetical protein RISK_000785 [Rhodopirellula islandica]